MQANCYFRGYHYSPSIKNIFLQLFVKFKRGKDKDTLREIYAKYETQILSMQEMSQPHQKADFAPVKVIQPEPKDDVRSLISVPGGKTELRSHRDLPHPISCQRNVNWRTCKRWPMTSLTWMIS